jgi:hypothetical protein
VMCVASAPEIAMSLGTRAAGNRPTGDGSPHRAIKADPSGKGRIGSVAASGVSLASPFA